MSPFYRAATAAPARGRPAVPHLPRPAELAEAARLHLRLREKSVLHRPAVPAAGERLAPKSRKPHPRRLPGPDIGRWTNSRDLPRLPAEPFRDWWKRNET
ncbi:DUF3390 domain-containing protein [Streptomyces sp. SID8381]|uniref:lactate utilisation protein LutB domain-containing protein n=1 Tax=Streptomyces sp. Amel2xE9 TaxID=1157634 RepID=UPI0003A74522|nr:DUF3390 domain-containing protein [Streptomyces sp. SID8381]